MSPQPHPLAIQALATLTPPSTTRAWQTAPHPTHPLAATASSDKSVRVYSLATFGLLSTVAGGHKRSVRACAWKPHTSGEVVLATGSFDASAGIWRKRLGRSGAEVDCTAGGQGEEDDEEEEDEEEYAFTVILDGHESEIKSLAWSPSGRYLATCSRDKSVWIWEDMDDSGDDFETVAVLQEHEGDVKCVAWHPTEELLASGSYDDDIRLWREEVDDWVCCARLTGHTSTVWGVAFEAKVVTEEALGGAAPGGLTPEQAEYLAEAEKAGPRLVSCSDDLSIRIWKRRPKEKAPDPPTGQGRMPSILRTTSVEEDWYLEAVLPQRHERAVYSVGWSGKSGLIVSTGSDGKIILYKERWKAASGPDHVMEDAEQGPNGVADTDQQPQGEGVATEWVVVAEFEGAHDVFEVNHVCWTRRKDKGRTSEDEEMLITTGDDGEVKLWTIGDS